jgi:low affinity Fe/Cu permease
MTDLEDIAEAVFDIEDLLEEIAEPEELIEDFVADPLVILVGLVAGIAGVIALFLFLLTALLLVLTIGPIRLLAVLTVVSFLTMLLGIGAFLYMRTDIPANVQEKIDAALQQADETPNNEGGMTEQEAINEIKTQYANGDIDDYELDAALERVLTSERPERVVEEYN